MEHCSTIALAYVAPGYASDTASSNFVPIFSLRVVLACFDYFRVPVFSDLLCDPQCTRVFGFSVCFLQVRGVGVDFNAPHLRSILRILRMGLVPP